MTPYIWNTNLEAQYKREMALHGQSLKLYVYIHYYSFNALRLEFGLLRFCSFVEWLSSPIKYTFAFENIAFGSVHTLCSMLCVHKRHNMYNVYFILICANVCPRIRPWLCTTVVCSPMLNIICCLAGFGFEVKCRPNHALILTWNKLNELKWTHKVHCEWEQIVCALIISVLDVCVCFLHCLLFIRNCFCSFCVRTGTTFHLVRNYSTFMEWHSVSGRQWKKRIDRDKIACAKARQ